MWATVRIWMGSARPGRCTYCKRPLVWVMTDKGKWMPFDVGFSVREVVTHPTTRAQFCILDRKDRHDCIERRQQTDNKRSQPGGSHGGSDVRNHRRRRPR